MRLTIVVLVLLALAGAGVFLLLSEDGRGGDGLDPASLHGSADLVPGTTGERPEAGAVAAGAVESVPFAPEPGDAAGAEGLWVHVEDQEGLASPGIVVEVLGRKREPVFVIGSSGRGRELLQKVRSNSKGDVCIHPVPRSSFAVRARSGELFGQADLDPRTLDPNTDQVLVLLPVRRVLVHVVDASGVPVPDALVKTSPDPAEGEGRAWSTAPDGTAGFEVTARSSRLYGADGLTVGVRTVRGFEKAARVPWNPRGVTEARVVLKTVLTLHLTVVDGEGGAAPGSYRLKVARRKGGASVASGSFGGFASLDTRERRFQGARTSMAGFAADEDIDLVLLEEGRVPVKHRARTPPGGRDFDVTMTRGARVPQVTLRAVDAGGEPLAGFSMRATIGYDGAEAKVAPDPFRIMRAGDGDRWLTGKQASREVKTDDHGRLALPVRPDLSATLAFHLGGALWFLGGQKVALARVAVPAVAAGKQADLGDLRFEQVDLLVGGTVVDADGHPVEGALVRLAPQSTATRFDPVLFQLTALTARTDADGRFRIRSGVKRESLAVVARQGTTLRSEEVPFQPGTADVQLRLEPNGALSGRLVIATPGCTDAARISLDPEGPKRSIVVSFSGSGRSTWTRKDGSFNLNGVFPGMYSATVRLGGIEVLKVDGIKIVSGATTRDPRLDGVKVGEQLQLGIVTVTEDDLAPVKGARVSIRIPPGAPQVAGERGRRTIVTDERGEAQLLMARGAPRDVSVEAKGFSRREIKGTTLPASVRLDRGCDLTVVVEGQGALPVNERIKGWRLDLEARTPAGRERPAGLTLLERPLAALRTTVLVEPGSRSGTFRNVSPGAYNVRLRPARGSLGAKRSGNPDDLRAILMEALEAQRLGLSGKGIPLGAVEVPPAARETTARLALPPGKLEALLNPPPKKDG